MLDVINETFQLNRVDLRGYSPLALAFIGDSVFATVVKAPAESFTSAPPAMSARVRRQRCTTCGRRC